MGLWLRHIRHDSLSLDWNIGISYPEHTARNFKCHKCHLASVHCSAVSKTHFTAQKLWILVMAKLRTMYICSCLPVALFHIGVKGMPWTQLTSENLFSIGYDKVVFNLSREMQELPTLCSIKFSCNQFWGTPVKKFQQSKCPRVMSQRCSLTYWIHLDWTEHYCIIQKAKRRNLGK